MSKKRAATIIFNKWKSDFVKFDKKKDAVKDNFDSLFYDLYAASVPFDIAFDIIDPAVAHHFPSDKTAKYVWKIRGKYVKMSYKEWLDCWKDSIKSKAEQSFYDFFPLQDHIEIEEKAVRPSNTEGSIATDDEMNEEDFYKSSKHVTRESPWLFGDKEG